MLNVEVWKYLPISEARGALGTVPCRLRATLYLRPSIPLPKVMKEIEIIML